VQAHAIEFKRPMLNPRHVLAGRRICFAIWGFYTWRLNRLGLKRDQGFAGQHADVDQEAGEHQRPGILVYSLTMTAAVIYWVMSLDVTWYSSVYGLLFLVGQGYSVLALGIIVVDFAVEGRAVQDDSAPDRAARPGQVHLSPL
jgi:hypothetical protein